MKKFKKNPNKSTKETLDSIFEAGAIQIKPKQNGSKITKIDIDDIDTTTEVSVQNGNDVDQNLTDVEVSKETDI